MRLNLLLALVTALCVLYGNSSQAETITLAADVWCPYNCTNGGYMIEIARDIFQKENIDVDYHIMPWTEALEKTRSGEFDAIVGASHEDARDFIFPQTLQGMSDMRLWVLEDSKWVYGGIASLKNVRLGVIENYSYSKELTDYIKANANNPDRIYIARGNNALEDNLTKLKSKKVDVIAEDDNVINYYMSTRNVKYAIKSVGTPIKHENISSNYLYIAFSPKNPNAKRYAKLLDEGMKGLRESGQLKDILNSYQVTDWYAISHK